MSTEPIVCDDPFLQQLLEDELVSPEQIQELLDERARTGKTVREILLALELLSENELMHIIAAQLSARVFDLNKAEISDELFRSIPASVARMYNVLPIEINKQSVVLATCDLLSPELVDELRFVLSRDVAFVVVREQELCSLLNEHYGDESASMTGILSALEGELKDANDFLKAESARHHDVSLEQAASAKPVIRFVNLVLYQAAQDKASDIHFEPFEDEFKIRYRVDGALYELTPPPIHLALPVVSRIKVIAGLNIAERRLPQDGRIQIPIGGRIIDFRVSTLPTQFGESVVLRVLDKSVVSLDLDLIGMPQRMLKTFLEDIQKPNGIIVVTGPTGSGKTTTLYSALSRINTIERKILTAEDPVEYDIEGIIQVPINESIGLSFAHALRSFLRQDPDVVMVGEIRDLETAQIAIQASLTGHLVFSTLHTNDAPGAINRLIDMNVEPFLIASTVEAVVGQRLIRTICSHCKAPYEPEKKMLARLGLSRDSLGGRPFYFGKGCQHCHYTGYSGRCGIYEYLRNADPIRAMISERKPTLHIREKAKELGMRTLREDGIRCVLDGITTCEEVLRYT